LICNLN